MCIRDSYYTYKVVETKYKERYNEALGGMERYVVETKTCYVDAVSYTHLDVYKRQSLSSFPQETGHMGLNERCDLISSFEKVIQDMNKLGKYDLQMFYMRNKMCIRDRPCVDGSFWDT